MKEVSPWMKENLRRKMAGPILACENVQPRASTKEDEKRGVLNHGTVNGNTGCEIHSMQQDADVTTSTSGDESVFVIQVRSPASKQLLHGQKRSIDHEELRSCCGEAKSKTTGVPRGNGPICFDAKRPVVAELCTSWNTGVQKGAETSPDYVDRQRQSVIFENVDAGIMRNANRTSTHSAADCRLNISERAGEIKASVGMSMTGTLRGNHEGGVKDVAAVVENGSVRSMPSERLKPLIMDASFQLDLGMLKTAMKEAETTDAERLAGNGRALRKDAAPISRHDDEQATFNPANGVEAAKVVNRAPKSNAKEASTEGCEAGPRTNISEVLNVYVRKRKRSNAAEIATVDSAVATEQPKSEDPLGERVIKHYVRRLHRGPDSQSVADMIVTPSQQISTAASTEAKENHYSAWVEHLADTSAKRETEGTITEQLNVFQRRLKKNPLPQVEHITDVPPKVEVEGNLNVFQRRFKNIHSPRVEQPVDISAMVQTEGNLQVFQRRAKKDPPPQAEHHPNVETGGNFHVFQRRSKMKLLQKERSGNDIMDLQKEESDKDSPLGYVRADHQPNWLPEGWTLEIRQGEATTRPEDKVQVRKCFEKYFGEQSRRMNTCCILKFQPGWSVVQFSSPSRETISQHEYYLDHKSGHIFRSKDEVLQFLEGGGMGVKVPLQKKKRPSVPISPAKHTGSQVPPPEPSETTQPGLAPPATSPGSLFSHLHPGCMKTTPVRPASAVSPEANVIDPTWANLRGPNGPIGTGSGTSKWCQGDGHVKDGGGLTLHGAAAANSSQLLSPGNGAPLPTGSPVPAAKSPSDQADTKNRGKLIFRLKRKLPDSEGGKGRSKRPVYEVIHVERASSSSATSTPTKEEQKVATGERIGLAVPSTPDSVKAQVEKPIPLENPSFTSMPSPVVMQPTVEQQQPIPVPEPGLENPNTMSNWGITHNPLQHMDFLQHEAYTALGIPATARSSGLQQMAPYSSNHTHVFLDPVTNTLPFSWQYPFTSHAFTTTMTTAPGPTLGPFPFVTTPSVPKTVSTPVSLPVFEHFPGVESSSVHLNATATIVACSESGVDSRNGNNSRRNAKLAEVQKVLTAPPKSLTKEQNTKILLGLGRRLSLAGLQHQKTNLFETPATSLEPPLESTSHPQEKN